MKNFICVIIFALPLSTFATETVVIDFEAPNEAKSWKTVNDNVMGGKSKGGFEIDVEKGVLVFAGATNTDGGGFSSIRTHHRAFDLGDATGVWIRFRSDARTYQFDLRKASDRSWMPIAYRTEIPSSGNGEWETAYLPFSDFMPTRFGRKVAGTPIVAKDIGAMGFMIYDKLDGPFKMEVDTIGVYSEDSYPDEMPTLSAR